MNDQAKSDQQPNTEQPKPTGRDWFLQQLVTMANESGGGAFGVTLCVKGITISGVIASGRDYFAGFAQNVTAAIERDDPHTDAPTRQKIQDYFTRFGEIYPTSRHDSDDKPIDDANADAADQDDDDAKPLPEFVHLRNARIFNGQTFIPTNYGVWWRGRIAEVDGWFLGTLGR